ncbi:MAG: metallophosphoesterase [Chloroflexi bacterium]|nr:metallophosphoesterase [Chloroflexota bacterium]
MKILTLADQEIDSLYSPALQLYAGGVECVLACGDLPIDYLEYILTVLGRPLYYVHGNHAQSRVDRATGSLSENIEGAVNIHGKYVNQRGLLIAGLEGCLRYRSGNHQYTDEEMSYKATLLAVRLLRNRVRYGRALDILITHAPPYGIHDQDTNTHRGFRAYLPFMRFVKPRYLVHGHTHIYRNDLPRRTMYHETQVINTYGYQILELELPGEAKTEADASAGPRS